MTSHCDSSDITESRTRKNSNQSEYILSQPTANGMLPHTSTGEISFGVGHCIPSEPQDNGGTLPVFSPELRPTGWTFSQEHEGFGFTLTLFD